MAVMGHTNNLFNKGQMVANEWTGNQAWNAKAMAHELLNVRQHCESLSTLLGVMDNPDLEAMHEGA